MEHDPFIEMNINDKNNDDSPSKNIYGLSHILSSMMVSNPVWHYVLELYGTYLIHHSHPDEFPEPGWRHVLVPA